VKDERVYLLHALDAIDAIVSYTADGRDAFFADGCAEAVTAASPLQ